MSALYQEPDKNIIGERILLKKRNPEQATQMFALIDKNREHLRTWMPWEENTKTVEHSKAYLDLAVGWWESRKAFDFSLFEKSSSEMIGSFGLHSLNWDKKTCELGYWIDSSFQGKGYISEAVLLGEKIALELGFHRIVVTCDRLNKKSQQVPQRLGFKLEAVKIDECIDRGRNRDTLQFVKLINPSIEGRVTENLPAGFSIAQTNRQEFNKTVGNLKESIFDETELCMWPRDVMSEHEKEKLRVLNAEYKDNYDLYLVLFYENNLAGWSFGYQDTKESFCMANSAILPEYRGRGLYSCILENSLRILSENGFQRIWSSHKITNNKIIVSKLKRGFVITGTRVIDMIGLLVELTYFTNPTRKKVMEFRAGMRPDKELKMLFKL